MPGTELDRAKRLLSSPGLSSANRDRILSAFPELGDMSPATAPSMPMSGNAAKDPYGYDETVSPSARVDPDPYGYGGMAGVQTSIADTDYRPDDPAVRNLSKRYSLYAEPEINTQNDISGGIGVYYHFEPTINDAIEFAEKSKNAKMLSDLNDKGKDSEAYKTYADTKWKRVRSAFESTGEPAIRLEMLDPDSTVEWIQKLAGTTKEKAVAFAGGMDDAVFFGLGKQALSAVHAPMKAEKALIESGVIKPYAKRLADIQSENPFTSLAGNVAGFMVPGGASARVARAASGLSKGAGLATKIAVPFAEGGVAGLVTDTIEQTGKTFRGEGEYSPVEAAMETAGSSLLGGVMGGAAETLGAFGMNRITALRENPIYRDTLSNLEAGEPDVRGGTALPFVGTSGVRPNKIYAEKAKDIARDHALAVKHGRPVPDPKSPVDEIIKPKIRDMQDVLFRFKNETTKKIAARLEPYYDATKHTTVSMKDLGERLVDLVSERSTKWLPGGKQPLPYSKKIVDELERTIGNLQERETGEWLELNPRQLQKTISDLEEMVSVESNKTTVKDPPDYLKQIRYAIREIRDRFPANEYAPEEMVEKIETSDGVKTVKGGLSALTAWSKREMDKVRNAEHALGLTNVKPDDLLAHTEEILRTARDFGAENRTLRDNVLRDLFDGRRDIVAVLDAARSGQAYEDFLRNNVKAGLRTSGTRVGAWTNIAMDKILGFYPDPLFRALSTLEDTGGNVGAVASTSGGIDRYIPAAEKGIQNAISIGQSSIDGISLLLKLHEDADKRGLLDDIRNPRNGGK